jgi:hypothetical protein
MRVTVLMQRAGGAAGVDAGGRGGLETGGCGGERGMRGAQSTQSAPYAHIGNSEPGLSQQLSEASTLVFIQSEEGGGEVPPRKS